MNAVEVLVLLAYASLGIELVVFPIPSEASTWQLLSAAKDQGVGALARARRLPLQQKVLMLVLPTAVGIAVFLIPLACVAWPAAREVFSTWHDATLVWVGLPLVLLGRLVTFVSVLQLRAQRRSGGGSGTGKGRVRALFRWSRNPGLTGMFTFYIGLCLVFGAPVMWLGLPLYVGNMHRRVLMEEANLQRCHGDLWRDYARQVPRYIGVRRLGSAS